MAGERKITTNADGEAAIISLKKLGYTFPDIQSSSQDVIDGNQLVELVRTVDYKVESACDKYKNAVGNFLIELSKK